jgi:hypothetical protein
MNPDIMSVRFNCCPFCFNVLKLLQQSFSRHNKTPKASQRLYQMPKLVYGQKMPKSVEKEKFPKTKFGSSV